MKQVAKFYPVPSGPKPKTKYCFYFEFKINVLLIVLGTLH